MFREEKESLQRHKNAFEYALRRYDKQAAEVRKTDILNLIEEARTPEEHKLIAVLISKQGEAERILNERLFLLSEMEATIRNMETQLNLVEAYSKGLKKAKR